MPLNSRMKYRDCGPAACHRNELQCSFPFERRHQVSKYPQTNSIAHAAKSRSVISSGVSRDTMTSTPARRQLDTSSFPSQSPPRGRGHDGQSAKLTGAGYPVEFRTHRSLFFQPCRACPSGIRVDINRTAFLIADEKPSTRFRLLSWPQLVPRFRCSRAALPRSFRIWRKLSSRAIGSATTASAPCPRPGPRRSRSARRDRSA